MGDPLKKVQDGDRLRIPAAAYNAFVDAARKVRADQQGVGAKALRASRSTSIVLVQNNSGGTVGRFGILGIDSPIVGPSANLYQFQEQVALSCTSPTSGHAGKFVILLEPLADGGIGQAVVDGVASCRVVFTTGTETRADVLAGNTTRLSASAGGSASVLWKEAGTGEKWAVVRLETQVEPLDIRLMRLDENLANGGDALATQALWDGANWLPTGPQERIYDSPQHGPALAPRYAVTIRSPDSSRLEVISLPSTATPLWAYATADWVNGPLNTSKVVCEAATGKDGGSAGGGTFDVFLPRPCGSQDPNVRQGAIIAYLVAEDGNRIAVHGYLDDCIGTVKVWSGSVASIKPGWHLCDGGAGTLDLREKFVLGAFGDAGGTADFDYDGNSTNVGDTGGLRRELVNWAHTAFGSEVMRTFNTVQEILQTESFHTEKEDPPLTVSATGTAYLSGYTDYAETGLAIITERGVDVGNGAAEALHYDHQHNAPSCTVLDEANGGSYFDQYVPTQANCDNSQFATGTQLRSDSETCPEPTFDFAHFLIEPGAGSGAYTNPSDPETDDGAPEGTTGHRHAFAGATVDLRNRAAFDCRI
jgi:hypothetical protein